MQSMPNRNGQWKYVVLGILVLGLSSTLFAQNDKDKKPAPAAKPAPAKPAPAAPQHPAGGGSANNANHPSPPPANGETARHPAEPTANHPAVPAANHPGERTAGTEPAARPAPLRGPEPERARAIDGGFAPHGITHTEVRGGVLERRPDGQLRDVHDARRGMDVHHGLDGSRRISVERADHSRIFAERGRPGYIQHPYSFHGHDYDRRTYYYHGHAYDRFYRGYYYNGVALHVYAPSRYYSAGFYGWAYNPWGRPVVYAWGFGGAPWYGYYNPYFTPYPAYPTASYWLTDYMISQDLQEQYQAMQENQSQGVAPYSSAGAAPLTPEVKQMISEEVRNQLALESSEGQQNAQNQDVDPGASGISRMLADGRPHVFVVGAPLDLVDASGAECSVSEGDALQMPAGPGPNAPAANLVVLSSKGGRECRKSDTVTVALNDLQDMQNHMRETIDQGLQELQAKQGQGGLPPAPPAAPIEVAYAKEAPPPDPAGAAQINQQLKEADAAEQDVVGQAKQEGGPSAADSSVPPPPPPAPITIALGQTIDQVTTALGQPTRIIDLGVKKIYQYPDMKITFKAGKVAEVQ